MRTLESQPVQPGFFTTYDETLMTWLGMAGLLVNARGTIILIDPLISMIERDGRPLNESGHRMKCELPILSRDIPRVDVVMYTHAENDHYGALTAEILNDRFHPLFAGPPPIIEKLTELDLAPQKWRVARDFENFSIGATEVLVTPCLHDHPYNDRGLPWSRGECVGYVIRTSDGSIWHPGDTRLIDDLYSIRNVDVILFDVAAVESHLGPDGSAKIAVSSGAKYMFAYHYGTFDLPPGMWGSCDPDDSLPFVRQLAAKWLTPRPGETLSLQRVNGECCLANKGGLAQMDCAGRAT
jgi:L-ascorbate metabolism protein UlaG (beta-lactamase superfamily)